MFRREHEAVGHFASDLNRPGVSFVDDIANAYSSTMLLGEDASPEGLAKSLLHGRNGDQIDSIGPYIPGVDSPVNINYRATYASGKPYAKKVLAQGAPHRINFVFDAPPRTELLEGREKLSWMGNYALAFTSVVGEYLGDTELRIYHPNSDADNGLIYDGEADAADVAFSKLSNVNMDSEIKPLETMLETVARDLDEEHDATVVVSDFMDGFDAKTGVFSWENAIQALANRQQDLMRILRVTSITHRRLPVGVIDGLDMSTVSDINEAYVAQAVAKENRIKEVLSGLMAKTIVIGTNDKRPSTQILKLLKEGDVSYSL